ncbi:hypothetical protein PH5382_01712 [Phaeobacter sp. CECT 5382]|uniref:hypothetical protein n=1 Tax=Rhodobacterales TaxID=204455 RepID=UPI0006D9F2D6|nr:hypothetical protein [Phaeobacter sp. CECT 5382]CUH87783.1 hypothetical protein PH5382_01712 [Phaeobacter sp. CECT 5382]
MIRLFLVLGVVALAACDLPQSYATPPKDEPKQEKPAKSGVSVSGYARVGVSHRF